MRSLSFALSLSLFACAHTAAVQPPASTDLVSAADRTEADRALDPGRKPAALLDFLKLRPGMRVADLGAGGGYTTELLARAVAPDGVVYGQNAKWVLERFAEKPWSERLTRPAMKNVVRLDRELEDPLGPGASALDLVMSGVIYHDAVWLKVDREKMNQAVFAALKPGGAYVVCDSSAKPGSGLADAETLHRIDEQTVRAEVAAAGFTLATEGNFLRNPGDARDWSASPGAAKERRGTSDRFCLRFERPRN